MISAAYYYKHNSHSDIYHSILSLKKNLTNLDKIYVLTDDELPFDIEDVIVVNLPNEGKNKADILITKLKRFCEMGLCEEFIHLSGDFFVNKPFSQQDLFPPMAIDDMDGVVIPYENMPHWNHLLLNSLKILQETEHTTYNFATHTPSYVSCDKFLKMKEILPKDNQWQWQTCYNNIWYKGHRFLNDNPTYSKVLLRNRKRFYMELEIRDLSFFTIGQTAWNEDVRQLIQEMFGW